MPDQRRPIRVRCRPLLATIWLLAALAASMAIFACGYVGSSPNTSAPGGDSSRYEFWHACQEREDRIDEWEQDQTRELEDKLIDGEITFMRGAVSLERIEEDARAMRRELTDNCEAKADQVFGKEELPDLTPSDSGRFPTVTPR